HAPVPGALLVGAVPPRSGAGFPRPSLELRDRHAPVGGLLAVLQVLAGRHGHAGHGRQSAGGPVPRGQRQGRLRAVVVHRHRRVGARRHHPRQRARRCGFFARRLRPQSLPRRDPGRPRQRDGRDRGRRPHRHLGESLGRLPRSDPRRRREGGGALRRARAHPHDPALRSVREGRRGARLMQCGDFRVTYASDERIFDTRLPIVALAALLSVLALVPLVAGTYWLDVLNRIGMAIIGAVGLNILVGFTGQISIGHAAFLAVGAYSTAILETKVGIPFWLAIPLAAGLTSVFGLVFGVPSLRLKGLYLAIATLAAHFITTYGIIHWERMTNGVLGFNVAPAMVFGLPLDSDARIFYLIFALVVPAVFFAKNLFRTRVGRAF